MSSSSAAAPSMFERFPSICSPKASTSSPSHHIPHQESRMPTKTEQLSVNPRAPLSDMSFNVATDVCNDLSLGVDYENDFLSPADQNDSAFLPDIPKQPPSTVSVAGAAVSSSAINTTDSKLVVPAARTNIPHPVSPRHTFHPALLGTLFTPTFITMILPSHLHNLSHSLPPLLKQSANPAAATSSTVTTTSVKLKANNALVSQSQAQSDGQALTTVPQTQEERIIERNRKGRERSLRTRRRNAFRLQTLERNVVYLTTENNLLKDLVSTLSWLTQNPLSSASDSQNQSPHPLVIPFTALLLCALSRPPPYIPNNNRQYISSFRATPSEVNNYNFAAPSSGLLHPIATATPNIQQVKMQMEKAVTTNEIAEEQPTVKFEPEEENWLDREQSAPLRKELGTPRICEPQAELPNLTPPDFELSTEDFHFPSLNIDEIDKLLRDPTPDSPCVGTSLSTLKRN